MEVQITWFLAALGGLLIGLSAAILLVFDGRVAGVSGIVGGLVERPRSSGWFSDLGWKLPFLIGLVGGGAVVQLLYPAAIPDVFPRSIPVVIAAGLLVGFGTRLGNGCTSGHGVCGIGRLSRRSIVATVTFVATGALTVWGMNLMGGGL